MFRQEVMGPFLFSYANVALNCGLNIWGYNHRQTLFSLLTREVSLCISASDYRDSRVLEMLRINKK